MLTMLLSAAVMAQPLELWQREWPQTDFSRTTINLDDIQSGGPGKDGIPAIDHPRFIAVSQANDLADDEPVIGVVIGEEARAYPLRILIWHEIVNDVLAGTAIAVTYCPLCNTSIVFDRRLAGRTLDFGTTGNLRHSDLVMYDRQTESWWQQYGGEAIVGELAGQKLRVIPSRLESLAHFRQRAPSGQILVPNDPRASQYGTNPYVGYDRSPFPFLFKGQAPKGVAPMMRVVAIDEIAFALPLLSQKGHLQQGDLELAWSSGQRSALDSRKLNRGRDVGNVLVSRNGMDIPHVITFAFAFFAFHPDGILYTQDGQVTRQGVAD